MVEVIVNVVEKGSLSNTGVNVAMLIAFIVGLLSFAGYSARKSHHEKRGMSKFALGIFAIIAGGTLVSWGGGDNYLKAMRS